MDNCAYKIICKGICNTSSCIRNKKSEKEYWEDIQNSMVASARLERIRYYLSTKPKKVRTDIIEKWATLKKINNKKCNTCNDNGWVYEYCSNIEEPPKINCPSCSIS